MLSVSSAVLFVVLGSVCDPPTAALRVWITDPLPLPDTMEAEMTYVAVAPTGRETVASLMLPVPDAAQVPPPLAEHVHETPVSCGGIVSVTVTDVAFTGPALDTVAV